MIIIGHMLNFEGAHADVFEVFIQIGASRLGSIKNVFSVWRYHCRGMLIGCTRRAAGFSFIMAVPVFDVNFLQNTCIGYRFMLL